MADKEQEGGGGYLASAKSYIPGMGSVSDAASSGTGKAQEGLGAAGSATKDVTGYVPVVGSVVEGVGNTPVAQKIGGKEEEKGYLGSAYSYAGGALRTVYDAAGNVIGTVEEKAGTYLHGSEAATKAAKEDPADPAKGETLQKDQEVIAKNKAEGATQETADKASETADSTTDTAKGTASSLGETASDTTDKVKAGHRDIEDNVEAGAKDAIGQVRNATGTTEATEDANKGLEDTVGATKDTARGVEDAAADTGSKVVGGVGKANQEGAMDAAGGVKDEVTGTAGTVGEGAKGIAGGGADTVKGGVGALGSGASSAGGALGGMTGLSGGK